MRVRLTLLAFAAAACSCRQPAPSNTLDDQARRTIQSMGLLANQSRRPELQRDLYSFGPVAIDAIRDTLADPSYGAQPELIAVLSAFPDDKVQAILLQQIRRRDTTVVRQALQGLAMQPPMPSLEAVSPLASSKDDLIREWVLYALGRQRSAAARGMAINCAKDANFYLRIQAARALRAFDDAESLAVLNRLARDQYGDVSTEALISLARLAPGDETVRGETARIARDLEHASPADKIELAKLFGEIGTQATEGLLAKLLRDPDPRVRAEAAGAYTRLRHARDAGPLSKAITSDPDKQVRLRAAESIAKLDLVGAVPALHNLLLSKNPELMLLAAETLVRMRNAKAVGSFVQMSRFQTNEMQRYGAIGRMNQGLGDGKFFAIVDGIFVDTQSKDAKTRATAARMLGFVPGPKAENALRHLTVDSDASVRIAAMASLKLQTRMPMGIPPVRPHPLPSWKDFVR